MMYSSANIFDLAQLAEASYAHFNLGLSIKNALQLKNDDIGVNMTFSETQAVALADKWDVVTHTPNTDSGFSSTLFQNKEDDSYVLAFRGTETGTGSAIYSDLLSADLGDLVIDGLAIDQIVDLYNEWQRLSQSTYHTASLETLFVETALYQAAWLGQYVTVDQVEIAAELYLAYLHSRTDIIIDNPTGTVKTTRYAEEESTGLGAGQRHRSQRPDRYRPFSRGASCDRVHPPVPVSRRVLLINWLQAELCRDKLISRQQQYTNENN